MGALDEGHLDEELENGVKLGIDDIDLGTSVIEDAVKTLLLGLGEDPSREGLKRTPFRVAKAFREGTIGYHQEVKDIVQGALFPEAGLDNGVGHAGGTGGLVIVQDIDLFSFCESCLLPFKVQCNVGYIPSGQRVVGLSKLSRVANIFAKRLQDPQRLADEICMALQHSIEPSGVAVSLQCWHIRFPVIGKRRFTTKCSTQGWAQVSVCSGSGIFDNEDSSSWVDFSTVLELKGVEVNKNCKKSSSQCWCPSKPQDALACNGQSYKVSSKIGSDLPQPAMIAAATSILRSLGEDLSRKELLGTPQRFVQWLLNFGRSTMEIQLNNANLGKQVLPNFSSTCEKAGGDECDDITTIHSELNLPFLSQCEHHLLPFYGVAHVGFLNAADAEAINRTVLESIVHFYGCKLQVQERLTRQIAETAAAMFGGSIMVVVEANHICMISRGIKKVASSTATIAALGQFSTDQKAKASFLKAILNGRNAEE